MTPRALRPLRRRTLRSPRSTPRTYSSPSLELTALTARRSRHRVPRSDVAPTLARTAHPTTLTLTAYRTTRGPRLAPARSLQSTAPRFRLRCANDRIRRLIPPSRFRAPSHASLDHSFDVHRARTDLQVSPMAKPAHLVTPSAAPRFAVESACRCLDAPSIATPSPGGGRHVGDVESLAQHQGSGQPHRDRVAGQIAGAGAWPTHVFGKRVTRAQPPPPAPRLRVTAQGGLRGNDFWLLHTVRRRGASHRRVARSTGSLHTSLHRALDHCTLPCTTDHTPSDTNLNPTRGSAWTRDSAVGVVRKSDTEDSA